MNRLGARQRGASFWTMLLFVVVFGFLAVIGIKLVPIYLESWKIDKAITAVVNDTSVKNLTKPEIARALVRRLDIDDVRRINDHTWKEFVKITKRQNKLLLEVNYRVETPLFGNLSLVADFEKSAEG